MRSNKVLVIATLLVAGLGMSAHVANANPSNECAPLLFESGIADRYGNGGFIRISSKVQFIPEPSGYSAPQRGSSATVPAKDERPLYRYLYTFENPGDTAIKINFPDPDIVQSPLFETMQEFSVPVFPHSTETVEFFSNTPPDVLSTPVNIAIRDPERGRWSFAPIGIANVYIPTLGRFQSAR